MRTGFSVRSLRHWPGGVAVTAFGRKPERADVVVLATGAWLHELSRRLGVRVPMRAGRGYSFSVDANEAVQGWATSSDSRWLACCGPDPRSWGLRCWWPRHVGITLGPVTGRLLALSIATGGLPEALGAFTALR